MGHWLTYDAFSAIRDVRVPTLFVHSDAAVLLDSFSGNTPGGHRPGHRGHRLEAITPSNFATDKRQAAKPPGARARGPRGE